jgi:hypothetical protein
LALPVAAQAADRAASPVQAIASAIVRTEARVIRRRGLLFWLLAAPAIVRTPGLLMPVKPLPVSVSGPFSLMPLGRIGFARSVTEAGNLYPSYFLYGRSEHGPWVREEYGPWVREEYGRAAGAA